MADMEELRRIVCQALLALEPEIKSINDDDQLESLLMQTEIQVPRAGGGTYTDDLRSLLECVMGGTGLMIIPSNFQAQLRKIIEYLCASADNEPKK